MSTNNRTKALRLALCEALGTWSARLSIAETKQRVFAAVNWDSDVVRLDFFRDLNQLVATIKDWMLHTKALLDEHSEAVRSGEAFDFEEHLAPWHVEHALMEQAWQAFLTIQHFDNVIENGKFKLRHLVEGQERSAFPNALSLSIAQAGKRGRPRRSKRTKQASTSVSPALAR